MSHEIAGTYGLAAMDALHVAAALQILTTFLDFNLS